MREDRWGRLLGTALAAVDKAPHATQLESLNRQGVARFQGVVSTLRHWGYVEIRPDPTGKCGSKRSLAAAQGLPDRNQGHSYRLGLGGREYVRSPEAPDATVQQLLKARDAVQQEWSDLLDGHQDAFTIVRTVRQVLSHAVKV